MVDISMCGSEGCPNADYCYRKTAKPSEFWQSYTTFEYEIENDKVKCEYYITDEKIRIEDG